MLCRRCGPYCDWAQHSTRYTLFGLNIGAIDEVHYTSSSKVFLQCSSRFWEARGISGMVVSETLCKNTYFLPPFEGSDKGVHLLHVESNTV